MGEARAAAWIFHWGSVTALVMLAQSCALTSGSLAPVDETSETIERIPRVEAQPGLEVPAKSVARPRGDVGMASWYGPGFTGKKTASGQIFDDGKFTAEHNTLPFCSTAKITNLNNGNPCMWRSTTGAPPAAIASWISRARRRGQSA